MKIDTEQKIPVQAVYVNRENERWEVGNITRHPWAPGAFVLAVRVKDGQLLTLQKNRLEPIVEVE